MDMDTALAWAADRTHAALITIRSDGRPQSSDISYAYRSGPAGAAGTFDISVTEDRAKTKNMRRDNRVVLHLSDRDAWSYLAFDGVVKLTEVTTEPGDATSDALVAYFEAVSGAPHPDWDEFRAAMVSEGRLLAQFTPTSVVGQIH